MKKDKKYIAVGDIHGRDNWKFKLFGSSYEFEQWARDIVPNGIGDLMADQYPFNEYDTIIFIGDYVDSFTVSNVIMKKNLEDLMLFKNTYPDKVVLLLGNHDVQYIVDHHTCSGYRPEMRFDFNQIYKANINNFKIAHVLPTPGGPTLFTHAGVTNEWLEELRESFRNTPSHKRELFAEWAESPVEDILNAAWDFNMPELYNVDRESGGSSKWAGCLWVRPGKLKACGLDGYDQVVGHTPHPQVQMHPIKDGEKNIVYFIDCLEHGDDTDYLVGSY